MEILEVYESKLKIIKELFNFAMWQIKEGVFFKDRGYMIVVLVYYILMYKKIFVICLEEDNVEETEYIENIRQWVADNLKWPSKIVNTTDNNSKAEFVLLVFSSTDAMAFKLRWG